MYLDNAATTRVDPSVAEAVLSAMTEDFGNPSSAHRLGARAASLLENARERVARSLSAAPSELTFTSGGTEANALGFLGVAQSARAASGREKHVVVSGLEHPSIAEAARMLGQRGLRVTTIAPDRTGMISVEAAQAAIEPDTVACAIAWVQNEIGTVQPVFEIARAFKARAPRCHVHIDAVQALGKLPIDVNAGPIDSLSLSAHKIHGPKGVGALWSAKRARVQSLFYGGEQEHGLRPGTENVPGIVGFGVAAELADRSRVQAVPQMVELREQLWNGISSRLPRAIRHGDAKHSAPHILSVGFSGFTAEPLLHALEAEGVWASAGSACHARSRKPSAVLKAIGVADDVATLRFSLSRHTSSHEIALTIERLERALAAVRQ